MENLRVMKVLNNHKTASVFAMSNIFVASIAVAQEKPNIILIVADDLGYSDLQSFGSEIETPNLQKLADQGIKFSQYYTSPMSAPARSMIMTGNTNHQAGVGAMWWFETTKGQEGYELRLTDRTVTMAERFRDAGYETMMVGKWHIGTTPDSLPGGKGFNQSFALMAGGASHYSDMMPLGEVEEYHTFYTANDKRISKGELPKDFYSTKYYTDQIKTWIKDTPKDVPVFAYVAYTAPHDPLHAPDEWVAKYDGVYDGGYKVVYENRLKKLKEIGVIDENTPLPELNLQARWDALSKEQQQREAKIMQVYAAMVDYMDDQIGSLINTLKETGRLDNTIIIFTSDNGANATPGLKFYSLGDPEVWNRLGVNNDIDNIGKPGSFVSVGPDWAEINNAPYGQYHKATAGQGGINASLIIKAPMLDKSKIGKIDDNMIAAYDLAPTLYDLAGIELKEYPNALPMEGLSHKKNLIEEGSEIIRDSYGMELHNQLAYIKGDWKVRKITKTAAEAVDGEWALFNLKEDPLETNDRSADFPELKAKLIEAYKNFADKTYIIEAKGKRIWGSTK